MAWAGVFLGMVAGLCAAVMGYAFAGLPWWACFLIYPAAGTVVTLLATAILYWLSEAAGHDGGMPPGGQLAAA
ncbi:hypothetical protein [Leisingera sp. ANG-M7]|uniref:hypothetical protein n=1 Tax=Leisingera sp. ANG-M7 TaxID=1577902 RepID=UPI00057EE2C6|nr:hypothetical protein [Leisingera sp. ANG-M7]KIC38405.1 hypothetical protein RA26_04835 [Leisingera sp. ANG-M7]